MPNTLRSGHTYCVHDHHVAARIQSAADDNMVTADKVVEMLLARCVELGIERSIFRPPHHDDPQMNLNV